MKNYLPYFLLLLCACRPEPEDASPLYYITASRNETSNKLRENCVFRYTLQNTFNRLDNQSQQDAVKGAFDLWQAANPNLRFLYSQGNTSSELAIRFAPKAELNNEVLKSPVGLVRGSLMTLSASKKENNTHVILVSADYQWDAPSLKRVISHQIGLFLGLGTSSQMGSLMNPLFLTEKETLRLSKADSSLVNKLYPEACRNLLYNFLPLSFQVNKETPQAIILEKSVPLSVKASGAITVGLFLGTSTPEGIERGLVNFPIDQYNLVAGVNHAALMYKFGKSDNWIYCGNGCEIETAGVGQYLELIFNINDNDLTNNSGAYNVTVNYK